MEEEYFNITVFANGTHYRMRVYREYVGDSLERFKVVGGTRSITLQSNRPQLEREGSRKGIHWSLLEGDFSKVDPKQAAEALDEIIKKIELEIKERKPTMIALTRTKKDEK